MRLKHFLSVFLTLLTLSVGQMWGADQTYTLVSDISTITSSDKILIVSFNGDSKYYALKNNEVTTAGNLAAVEVSITSNTITDDLETDYTWVAEYKDNTTISNTSYRRYYFKSTKGNYYLQYGNANNVKCKITSKASTDGLNYWAVGYTGVNSTNSVTGLWNENSSRMFACYTSDFRAYASSNFSNINGHDVYIYKKASATTPSLSRDPASLNWNTVNKGTELSTKTFTISGSNLTGNLSVSATGGYSVSCGSSITVTNGAPSVTSITVTPPSTSTAGTKNGTITISGGGASSVSVSCSLTVNEIDQFIDDVQNTSGYTPENPHIEAGSYGTTPSLSHKTATTSGTCEQQHYHFIGWITAAKYEAGTSIADGDIQAPTSATGATYYAVWAKGTSGGEVFDHYEKVTTAPTDWTAHKYVYATADAGYVLTGKASGGNYGAYATMSTTTEMASYEITVENGSTDNYKLKQGGKYISCSSFGNLYWNDSYTAKTSSVNNGDWMFYKPSGTAFRIESPVKNNNNKWIYIDFNTSANPKRFNSYVSGNQTAVYLYKRVTTTGYTYFDYIAKCCTPLASINGSFFWTTHFCPAWPAKHRLKGY